MNTTFRYKNARPILTIDCVGVTQRGRCYTHTTYRVTSTRPLSGEDVHRLRESGLIGTGQEYMVSQKLADGTPRALPSKVEWNWNAKVEPSGVDLVPCQEVYDATGLPTGRPAINPYNGQPYAPAEQPYYVYDCVSMCNSSG